MRQEFNPLWFIPHSTYLSQYFTTLETHYPDNGQLASIYIQTTNLSRNLDHMEKLIDAVKNETTIVSRVDDWFTGFKEFSAKRHAMGTLEQVLPKGIVDALLTTSYIVDWANPNITEDQFSTYLKNYLFTQKGAKFRSNFKFADVLECRSTMAPPLSVVCC